VTLFQPFDPDDGNGKRKLRRLPPVPVRAVLPSLVTLVALAAGLTAIRMTIEGRYDFAVALIVVAAALDAIDGRIARLLKSTSRFGAELDSIADFVNFGVAPAVLLFVWSLDEVGNLGWIAVLVYAICVALRLARFNVALDATGKPEWHAAYFVGIPAPAGALVVLLPLYLEFVAIPHGFLTAPVTLVYTIAVALLMVSRVPTWSGKLVGRRIARDMVLPLFVCGVLVVAFLVAYPWQTLMVGSLAYLASVPASLIAFRRRELADAAAALAAADASADTSPEP
jgi:CDP-diacylglycerol---serine O-phosphatidyltransferase